MKPRHRAIVAALFVFGPCVPADAAAVLDGIGDGLLYNADSAAGSRPSQLFTDFPTFNCMVVDDFTVTTSELLIGNFEGVFLAQAGFESFLAVTAWQVSIFSAPDLPGFSLAGDVGDFRVMPGAGATVTLLDEGDAGATARVSLSVGFPLPAAGTYWFGISPVAASGSAGQFLVKNSQVGATGEAGGGNAVFANPGQGFGQGGLTALGRDHAYAVTAVPEPAAGVLGLVAGLCLLARRRRRPLAP